MGLLVEVYENIKVSTLVTVAYVLLKGLYEAQAQEGWSFWPSRKKSEMKM